MVQKGEDLFRGSLANCGRDGFRHQAKQGVIFRFAEHGTGLFTDQGGAGVSITKNGGHDGLGREVCNGHGGPVVFGQLGDSPQVVLNRFGRE